MTQWQADKVMAGRIQYLILPALCVLAVIFLGYLAVVPGTFREYPAGVTSQSSALATFEGQTMGTRYRILLPEPQLDGLTEPELLGTQISSRLNYLDRELMSTYQPDSQLSRFNRAAPGTPVKVDGDLIDVMVAAAEVRQASRGAFDTSVKALVDLWGFGAQPGQQAIPPQAAINRALQKTGMEHVLIDRMAGTLARPAEVTVDLSAIAKGYAVDEIALLLEKAGLADYLVEIGGEVITRGEKSPGETWQVGIESPEAAEGMLFHEIQLGSSRTAIATSGNYRNYFIHDGQRYSHIINPRTGWPVAHGLASVTVISESAMLADAWATALFVLGPEEGMKLANELQLAAYFILTGSTGFHARHSDAFNRYF